MRRRRLLLVTERPLDAQGGGSVRWSYFVRALPALGWDVSVVSRARRYRHVGASAAPAPARGRPRPALELADRLTQPLAQRTGLLPVAFMPHPLWGLTGQPAVQRAVARRRPDAILVTGPPWMALFAAAAVARRARIPFACELRDLWAGNPDYDAGRSALRRLEGHVFRQARLVVTVTPEAHARLAELHPEVRDRLAVLPNGFAPELLARRRVERAPRDGRAVLVHAGSLYATRSIDGLVDALSRPDLRDRVRLELLGGINQRSIERLEATPARLETRVRGEVAWEEAVRALRDADVAVVVFTPGDDTAVPGKLYEALALGRPVLALTDRPGSAMERLLGELGQASGCARHDDPDAIARAVERLLRAPPPAVAPAALAPFDRRALAEELAALLDRVCAPR